MGIPEWNELVLCTVTRITPFAAWCTIDEYVAEDGKGVEGMIHVSQVAGKWVKDIRKFVKPNKQYIARVVHIDREKGHINLSLKRVSKVDRREKMDNYRREKRSAGIINQIAIRAGMAPKDVYQEIVDRLGKDDRFNDLFEALEGINEDPSILKEAGFDKKLIDSINEVIEQNFRIKEKTIKASLEMTSRAPNGVEHLKKILSEIEKSTGGTVKYISAPSYQIEVQTKDPKETERNLRKSLDRAVEDVKKAKGEGSYEIMRG